MRMTTQLWESGGIQQRVIDIINQCRYLSSKRGMNLKELRKSLREDEARQRQIIRQNEKANANQMQQVCPPRIMANNGNANAPFCPPPWFAHMNSHGMLYSQYNVQNYGQNYTQSSHHASLNLAKSGPYTSTCSNNASFDCNCNICQSKSKFAPKRNKEDNTNTCSEDNLMAQRPPTYMMTVDSSGDELVIDDDDDGNENHLVRLLYTANKNQKRLTMNERHSPQVPMSRGRTVTINKPNQVNFEYTNTNPLVVSDSFVECNLPVRKLASHDLTMLKSKENETSKNNDNNQLSEIIMTNPAFTNQDESDDDDDYDSDESGKAELQVVEELDLNDGEKRVVSPLIKKVESAYANLQKKDSLFGSIDDFGQLMSKANKIF